MMGRSLPWAVAILPAFAAAADDPPARLVSEGRDARGPLAIAGVANPGGVSARPDEANPTLSGKNLYAPDFVRNGESWNLYYGGWRDPGDSNDRIFAAVCQGPFPSAPWAGREVVIDRGPYLHVNDPSVQRRRPGDWFLAFTVADQVGDGAWIAIATSRDGIRFNPRVADPSTEIRMAGAHFTTIARPALLWTGSSWKLWFDGKIAGGATHCYLAECPDDFPRRFHLVHEYPDVDNFPGFQEPDVALADGVYVAVIQRKFQELRKLTSRDGVNFKDEGRILSTEDPAVGRRRVSNPGWIEGDGGAVLGVGFGMTDAEDLTAHAIGLAYPQLGVRLTSPGGVTHLYGKARGPDVAVPMTFHFREFRRILVDDPTTHAVLGDFEVDARPGDRWRLVRDPPRGRP